MTGDRAARLSPVKRALLDQRLARGVRDRAAGDGIPGRPDPGTAPLSFLQRQMWVIDQMTPGNPAYNMPYGFRLRGPLDVTALERSFNDVIRRHEVLRTTFTVRDGEPLQRIHHAHEIAIDVTDLRDVAEADREARLAALASAEAVRSFDLSRLPLIRISLFALRDAEHVLLINLHHIIADGLSIGPLFAELDASYRAFSGGADRPDLPDLPAQYGDFAQWQRDTAGQADSAQGLAFWRQHLAGKLPVLELPGDRRRPAAQSFAGSNVFFEIPGALARELKAVGDREGATFFMTVLAAFQILLHRHAGAEDVIVGTPVSVRTSRDLEPLIGLFLNMVALRGDLTDDPTFAGLLRKTRDVTLDAFSHGDLPLETLMKHVSFERDASRNPIFQVALQVMSSVTPRLGALDVSDFPFDPGTAQFDLTLHLYEAPDRCRGRFEYCSALFEEQSVQRLCGHFLELLRGIASDPHRRISALPLLTEGERRQVLVDWNRTTAAYRRDADVTELVERQVERTPDAVALTSGNRNLTYHDLDRRANRLAHHLREAGVGRGMRVGICVGRSPEMVVAVLGVLKTGAAYVPLDPSFPEPRRRFMADDAELAALVSTTQVAGLSAPRPEHLVLLDRDARAIASAPNTRPPRDAGAVHSEDPAYVIYTSGSTGTPKGVVVPHRAVVNLLTAMAHRPGLDANDILVAVTTLSFDIAVLELLLPLTVGARVVLATGEDVLDGRSLGALLGGRRATVMQATPVTWRLALEAGWMPPPGFKALVGGETLPQDLADQLLAHDVELWNMYGPTETTVWSTCARIRDTSAGITIGTPIANTTVRIVDAAGGPCPIGVPGELCIGGEGVTLGYWKRPDLTTERFVPDPFAADPAARMYRTGDRARWRADGTLEHLGRFDDQVKVRGFRIEAGEVEAGIARHPAVREVAVVAREDAPGERRLVAYLVAPDAPDDLVDQIRALIRPVLPEYMVPSLFEPLDRLPRTPNGKLDRQALPAPILDSGGAPVDAVAPRTPTEATLMAVFGEVLGRDGFGVFDSFFDLGGDSLMAARLVLRLRDASGCDVPLRTLFERPSIAALAEAIDALEWVTAGEEAPAGERVEVEL